MLRAAFTVGVAALTASATPSPYTRQPLTPAGDYLVIGASPLPTCGHVEHRTDLATKSKHHIRTYDCDGHVTGPDVEVQLPDLFKFWALNHNDEAPYAWPVISGRQGGFVIVYVEETGRTLHTAIFNSAGVKLSDELEFVDPSGQGQWHPDVSMLEGGGFAVTWHSAIRYKLYLSVYAADGSRSVRAEEISDFGNRPRVVALVGGGWAIAYEARGSVEVTIQPSGGLSRTTFQVSQTATQAEIFAGTQPELPSVATLSGSGGFAVVWNYNGKLFMRRYDGSGSATTGIVQLRHTSNTAADDQQLLHTLTGIGAQGWGGYVVSWIENSALGYNGIVSQEYSDHGVAQGQFYEIGPNFRPHAFYKSAGYGITFFEMQSSRKRETETFLATCETLPAGSMCPAASPFPLPVSTACATFPCKLESCCRVPFYGVRQNGVELALTPVSGATAVSGQGLNLVQVPDVYSQMDAFFPALPVAAGAKFEVECGDSASCTFLVVVYHCPPCSKTQNLGFPASLPAAGWTAGSCAPKIEVNGAGFPMTAFRLDVARGETVELPVAQTDSSHVAVFGYQAALPALWCQKSRGPAFNGVLGCSTCL